MGMWLFCSYRFFFSSRRRHTRSDRDWSSDVCSSDLRVVSLFTSRRSKERTLERNRRRVQSAIDVRVAVGARPIQLIWDTGKIRIGTETTNIGNETHGVIARIDTVHVVIANQMVIAVQIVHAIPDTVAIDIPEWVSASAVVDPVAVLVMPDLVGKRNVVTVSRPGVSRFFTGCGVRGMKVNRLGRADPRIRLKEQLHEPIRGACNHRALFAGRKVVDRYFQSLCRVLEFDAQQVTRIEKERIVVGWNEAGETGTSDERTGALGFAAHRNKGKVHVFGAEVRLTVGIVERSGILILGSTIDVECRAPLIGMIGVAATERRARRIELHLHETGARMPADVVGVRYSAAEENVCIAIGFA